MAIRLGDILVRDGLLTENQRLEIIEAQKNTGRPFGVLAEEYFGVSPKGVEQAWAEQFAEIADWIDPLDAQVAPDALATIEARQAWQFRCLPLWYNRRELLLATDAPSLPRAMRFVGWRIAHQCRFVLADARALNEALQVYYPMGIDAEFLDQIKGDMRA